MDCKIVPMSLDALRSHLETLLSLDRASNIGEPWTSDHYLSDLPGKWECSALAFDAAENANPIGLVVASIKPDSVHIHRLAVDSSHQGHGIGKRLIQYVARRAAHRHICLVTLKVAAHNSNAIGFYERLGFAIEDAGNENLALNVAPEVLLREASCESPEPRMATGENLA